MLLERKILVVEDNEINRAAMCAILSPQYTVLEAENGVQALSLLEKYREGISLILLDIVMPVMDGYAFLKHLKADHRLNSIPVIVTTSNNSEADEVAALSNGATDFITKPLSFIRSSMTGSPECTARNISASRSGTSCFGIRM